MERQSLNSRASQETFISLLQLDPLPIETPPIDREKDLPPLPEETSSSLSSRTGTAADGANFTPPPTIAGSSTTSTLGLSGSGSGSHSAIYYLTRIQRYSSYAFGLFASLHIATTSVLPLLTRSVPASESYLLQTREIYQTSLSEPLLVVLPILAHVASGVALRLVRRAQNLRRYGGATPAVKPATGKHGHDGRAHGHGHGQPMPLAQQQQQQHWSRLWPPLSYISVSGYGLAVFVGAHVFMNRVLPLLVEGDSSNISLVYVGHGFARHPLPSWLAYLGLVGFGAGHVVWGWAKWLGFSQRAGWKVGHITGHTEVDREARRRRRRLFLVINGIAAAVAGLWAAGGLGLVARSGRVEGWVGKVYDGLYEKVGM
jgi:hypothetical protein